MAVIVRLTGRVGLEDGGVIVGGGIGRLGRVALAYLMCERHRPVPREELAELLWGADQPRSSGQLVPDVPSRQHREPADRHADRPPGAGLRH